MGIRWLACWRFTIMFRLNVHTLMFWLLCSALLFCSIEQCRIERRFPGVFADIDRRLRRDRAEIKYLNARMLLGITSFAEAFPNEKNRRLADLSFTYIQQCEAYCNFIDTVKQQLVAAAGGPSDSDPWQPRDPHNRDAISRVLLESTDGKPPLLEQIGQRGRALRSAMAEEPLLKEFARLIPLYFHFFEENPRPEQLNAAGALAVLSNLQAQATIAIAMALNHLFERGADYGNLRFFDAFEPTVIAPSGGFLVEGEQYTADLFLSQYFDRPHTAAIKVNGVTLPLKGRIGRFETYPEHPGRNTFTVEAEIATINFNNREAKFVIDTIRTSKTFSFYAGRQPFAQIQPKNGQFLYAGIDNPLYLTAPGISPDSIRLKAVGMKLQALGAGRYLARPDRVGNTALTLQHPHETPWVVSFPVRPLPDPVLTLGDSLRGGRIGLAMLDGQRELKAAFPDDFDFQADCQITDFSLTLYRPREDPRSSSNAGHRFSPETLRLIASARPGDRLVFENISVRVADETAPRPYGYLSFVIRE